MSVVPIAFSNCLAALVFKLECVFSCRVVSIVTFCSLAIIGGVIGDEIVCNLETLLLVLCFLDGVDIGTIFWNEDRNCSCVAAP